MRILRTLESLESLEDGGAQEVVSVCPADPDVSDAPLVSPLHLHNDTRHPQLTVGGFGNLE